MKPKIVILAGSHAQGMNYVREKRLDPNEYVIPTRPEQVAGLDIGEIRRVGTWIDLPQPLIDAVEFQHYLGVRK